MIEQLKIGPLNYKVREVNDLHDTDDSGKKRWLHGHILYSETAIEVAADQSDDRKICTLWHEAVHGILDNAGHTNHPEDLVIALGFGLVDLIRNNPQLVNLTQYGIQHTTLPAEHT